MLRWSERRLDELKKDVRLFLDADPYTVTHERDPQTGVHTWRLTVNRDPPSEDWAMMFGDCIQNARAALDHMLWQLAGSDPADTKTQFPIFIDGDKFKTFGLSPIRKLDRRAQAFVKWLQPYRRDDPRGDALWPLQVMNAAHKHKTALISVGILVESTFKIEVPPYTRVRQDGYINFGPLGSDTEVGGGRFIAIPQDGTPPHTNVEVDAELAYGVAVEDTVSGLLVLGEEEIARILARADDVITAGERLF